VAASLSRTGVAVAALGMALTAMIGVAVMVESFRGSLRDWLLTSLRADVYVSAPGPSDALSHRLEPDVVRALLALPAVRAHSEARRTVVGSRPTGLDVNAAPGAAAAAPASPSAGEREAAWRAFAPARCSSPSPSPGGSGPACTCPWC
jgi:putative ABC transport system permease protein